MTINDIRDQLELEGYKRIQCWENDYPTIYYEGDEFYEVKDPEWLDREILYIFPFMVNNYEAGICIEVREKE